MDMVNVTPPRNRMRLSCFKMLGLIACAALVCVACVPREAYNGSKGFSPDDVTVFDQDLEYQASHARERAAACQEEIDRLETEIAIGMVDQLATAMKANRHSDPRVREQAAEDIEGVNAALAANSARQSELVAERDGWIRVLDRIRVKKEQQGGSGDGGGGGGGGGC
jgi:hypothetical protein